MSANEKKHDENVPEAVTSLDFGQKGRIVD